MAASSTNTGNFLFTIFDVVMMLAASLVNRATNDKFKAALNTIKANEQHLGSGNYGVICIIDDHPEDSSIPAKLLKVSNGSTSLANVTNLVDEDWTRTFEIPVDYTEYKGKDALFIGLTDNAEVYYIRHIDDRFVEATNGVSMVNALTTAQYIETVSKYGTKEALYSSCNVPSIQQFSQEPHSYLSLTGFWNPWVTETPPIQQPNFYNRYCVACSTVTNESGPYYIAFGNASSDMEAAIPPTFQLLHMTETPSEGKEKGIAFDHADMYYKITLEAGQAHLEPSSASEIRGIVVNSSPIYLRAYWVDSDGVVHYGSQIVLDEVTTTDDRDVSLKPLPYSGDVIYTSTEIVNP